MSSAPRTWVKICGLRTVADIEAAAAAGADAVGFVFHEGSPRDLGIEAARRLQRHVPAGVERVVVFRHPAQELVDAVLEAVRPDCVQTDREDLGRVRLPASQRVMPVLRAGTAAPPLPARFLFEGTNSGAGERADWSEATALARQGELVLAGGLDASNVGEALARVRPFGVDVSSGVEQVRGVKDPARIRDFVAAVRAADARLAGRPIEERSR